MKAGGPQVVTYGKSERIGSWAIVVEARDARAAAFYRHYGFRPFAESPLRPFLPMASVAQLPWRG